MTQEGRQKAIIRDAIPGVFGEFLLQIGDQVIHDVTAYEYRNPGVDEHGTLTVTVLVGEVDLQVTAKSKDS